MIIELIHNVDVISDLFFLVYKCRNGIVPATFSDISDTPKFNQS